MCTDSINSDHQERTPKRTHLAMQGYEKQAASPIIIGTSQDLASMMLCRSVRTSCDLPYLCGKAEGGDSALHGMKSWTRAASSIDAIEAAERCPWRSAKRGMCTAPRVRTRCPREGGI